MSHVKCETGKKNEMDNDTRGFLSEESIIARTENCAEYFKVPSYLAKISVKITSGSYSTHIQVIETFAEKNTTNEEYDFPIAWSHTLHHQVLFKIF